MVGGLVALEKVPPDPIHGVPVGEELLVELVDEPLIGPEAGERLCRHRGILSQNGPRSAAPRKGIGMREPTSTGRLTPWMNNG
jgi:hypothetical protein